jgi:hypothetical protein
MLTLSMTTMDLNIKINAFEPGVVVPACNSSTQEAEVGGL